MKYIYIYIICVLCCSCCSRSCSSSCIGSAGNSSLLEEYQTLVALGRVKQVNCTRTSATFTVE